jgi:hypothetical protein
LPVISTAITSTNWDPLAASQMPAAISRMTALSGSSMTLRLGTAHVILVESGSLAISKIPRGADPGLPEIPSDSPEIADSEPLISLPESVVVAGNNLFRIMNEGSGVAKALLMRIAGYPSPRTSPTYGALGTSQNGAGVQIETLAAAIALPNQTGA